MNLSFSCRCGQPIFFRNNVCLACKTPLGYDAQRGLLLPLLATDSPLVWENDAVAGEVQRYARCSNLETAALCNWLIPVGEDTPTEPGLCLCCRLTRKIPDLSEPVNSARWYRVETAKRRLIASFVALGLPVVPLSEDPAQGLAIDVLTTLDGEPPVMTGHLDGVITLDALEADDATREQRRTQLHEPYRTLLGHLRHESGHYYWRRLVENGPRIEEFRALFGDERADYAAALKQHYENGPPPDWPTKHVSAYASSHPWEDWAETWAHYLHMIETVDTALSFGIRGDRIDLSHQPFGHEVLGAQPPDGHLPFLDLLNGWTRLSVVLNELSRSMGVPDFYPYVLPTSAVAKLHLVHRVIGDARDADEAGQGSPEGAEQPPPAANAVHEDLAPDQPAAA